MSGPADHTPPAPDGTASGGTALDAAPSTGNARTRASASARAPRKNRTRRILGSFWLNLLAALLLVGLIQGYVVKLYVIPTPSMEQTLQPGDRVLVNRLAYHLGEPQNGDIVVFTASDTWHPTAPPTGTPATTALKWIGSLVGIGPGTRHTLAKRIIATGGQQVACCTSQGALLVDGTPLKEPYVHADLPYTPGAHDCTTEPRSQRCFGPYTVPKNQYFVLGDHRSHSKDSITRCRGHDPTQPCRVATVQRNDLIGPVLATIWPPSHWGGVN